MSVSLFELDVEGVTIRLYQLAERELIRVSFVEAWRGLHVENKAHPCECGIWMS